MKAPRLALGLCPFQNIYADLATTNVDKIHPTDEGYKVIADEWFNGIQWADKKNWIQPPVSVKRLHPELSACKVTKRANIPTAGEKTGHFCREAPKWEKTGSDGRISHGFGKNGDAKFKKNWTKKTRAGPGHNKKGQGHVK